MQNDHELRVSSSADRSNSVTLDGRTVSGDLYVFVSNDDGIAQVQFFINGSNSPFQIENRPPFDLAGTVSNGQGYAFDSGDLNRSSNVIEARITGTNGNTESTTATFVVDDGDRGGSDTPASTPAPAPIDGAFRAVAAGEFENSHPNFPPSNVIDGDLSTRWASQGEDRNVYIDLGTVQRVDDVGVAWTGGDERVSEFEIRARTGTSGDWDLVFRGQSSGNTDGLETYNVDDVDARFVRIKVFSNNGGSYQNISEVVAFGIGVVDGGPAPTPTPPAPAPAPRPAPPAPRPAPPAPAPAPAGGFGLNPNAAPQDNFDLTRWALDTPAGRPGDSDRAERINEDEYDDISDASAQFFYTAPDGGLRFETRIDGAKTSSGTSFVRSELRGMLRAGNRDISTTGANGNNWALGYQPGGGDHGAREGTLDATLAVNKVTTTGNGIHVGRTIIGQIHASDDEPLRLYYRKAAGDTHGCIYASHEIRNGDDIDFDIIGNEKCDDPSNGIELNELFSYEIIQEDEFIHVVIRRGDRNGSVIGRTTIDMDELDSGYDVADEWFYFKAGAYTQNNTGDGSDGDIITFYRLDATYGNN